MLFDFRRAFSSLLLICIIISVKSQDENPFPSIKDTTFYSTDVQITDEDLQVTAFASEFFDSTGGPRGRVNTIVLGNRQTVIYNQDTNQILEINSTNCQVWDTDESIYDYEPIFYGWLNKDPLVIGPTASLWFAEANKDKLKYEGAAEVRDISCDKWVFNYTTERNQIIFSYYFAVKDWTTPYKLDEKTRVPIRVEVRGMSSMESKDKDQWYPVNQLTDFAFFRPDIANFRVFQPPQGIGCPLMKETRQMPKMPSQFRYSAEVVDLLESAKHEVTDIEYQQVWYDSDEKLARLDKYTQNRAISELYDFNTGVTYSLLDRRTCSIKPLRYSFFEGYDGKMVGHLKDPDEVLGLDGSFYYLGKKLIRGIWSDVFESVKQDVVFMKKTLVKLVITMYYSQEFYEVAVDGETETRVPIFYAVKGWDTPTTVAINLQYNIFGFDDVIYPDMYATFRLGRCFPSMNDKSYFILVLEPSAKIAATMEGVDDYVMEQLRAKITENAKISNLRLPFLRADYKTTGVYVTGLMLDRPPALRQFWMEREGYVSTADPKLRVAPAADTDEKCAFACVDEGSDCVGFYWCNKACFLKFKDILEPDEGNINYDFGGTCQEWLRAERNSKNKEPYLADALQSLENAVLKLAINISIKISEKDRSYTIVPVTDIVIGDGPYVGTSGQEKPYNLVINYAKLDPTDETTEVLSYIDNLNDCYQACKNSEDLSCSSFSYCPDSDNKQCSLSSVLVVDRKNNPDDTIDDKNCYVYSMKYLDFFNAYPGRVALIPGIDVFKGVKTAEECAKNCRQSKKPCRGFEFCHTEKTCVLHAKHVLDLNPGEVVENKKATCIHYAARYAADYLDMGHLLLDDKMDERSELSLEDCAKVCSEEFKDKCKSFNYCPASGPYMTDSSCTLSSLTLESPRVSSTKTPPCHHFEKKKQIDDWKAKDKKKSVISDSGYTSGGFTWLVIGMLVLGFALGAIGFVVYSYFRSKGSDMGMSVRFMKQGNM